jgi:hypothetical protein
MKIEIVNMQSNGNSEATRKAALVEALMTGTRITATNEDTVDVSAIELTPFIKIRKPSRSSRVYDKVE